MIKMKTLLGKVVDNEYGYDCVSRQIEYLIMDCDSLAEAIHNVHTFTAVRSYFYRSRNEGKNAGGIGNRKKIK